MRYLIVILASLMLATFNISAVEKSNSKQLSFFCLDVATKFTQFWSRSEDEIVTKLLESRKSDWCGAVFNKSETEITEIPEEVFRKIEDKLTLFYEEEKKNFFKSNKIKATAQITNEVIAENSNLIEKHRSARAKQIEELPLSALGKRIETQRKKNQIEAAEAEKRIDDQRQSIVKYIEQEKTEKNKKEKQKIEEDKTDKLLASMRPDERRAFICEKTYGFKKGSDRFADCVFKIMTTDAELEKLDKQRRIAEAQLKTEKEKAPAYDPAIGRAAEKAVEIEAARLRREQEEENARLMFALSKGLGTPGGFNSKVQGTVDSLNPNQNRRTKRVCNSLRTASGYQTVCKDVPY